MMVTSFWYQTNGQMFEAIEGLSSQHTFPFEFGQGIKVAGPCK